MAPPQRPLGKTGVSVLPGVCLAILGMDEESQIDDNVGLAQSIRLAMRCAGKAGAPHRQNRNPLPCTGKGQGSDRSTQ